MTCDRVDLSAFVDGELPPQQALEVERHLASCPACAAEIADLRALAAALAVPEPPPPRERAVEAAVSLARAAVGRHAESRHAEAPDLQRPSLFRTLARFFSVRVSVPAPALAVAVVLLVLWVVRLDRPERPGFVRVTVTPVRLRSVHEEWRDARVLWEEPAVPASYDAAKYRVVYDESVQL